MYLFKDEKDKILYVGKAKDLKKRVSSYFSKKALDSKTIQLVEHIRSLSHIRVNSEIEAFLLEAELIKKYKPFYNIKLTDDKSYPLVRIDIGSNNPSVIVTRKKADPKALYFGPFTDATALKTVLKLIRGIFPYQSVANHQKRKCLYYHLGLCPCVLAMPENLPQYKKTLKSLQKFLEGKTDLVLKQLEKERREYVKTEEFERAQAVQKKIERINLITSQQFQPFKYIDKPDFYYERIKKEVDSLRDILQDFYPDIKSLARIECYDISNIQGKNAVGSMVVFINGEQTSKEYRRFKIHVKDTPDDFLMMQEMLTRRLKNTDWPHPNLLVIDGGKGQVGAVLKVLVTQKKVIPLIGLAKREEIIVIPQKRAGGIEFIELNLPNSTPGINLLRRLRDEAHRFAITYHRLLRKKNMFL